MSTYKEIYELFVKYVEDFNYFELHDESDDEPRIIHNRHTDYDQYKLRKNINNMIHQAKTLYIQIQLGFEYIGTTFDPVKAHLIASNEDEMYISLISSYKHIHNDQDRYLSIFENDLQAIRMDCGAVYYPEYIASSIMLECYLNNAAQHPNYESIENTVHLTKSEEYVFDRCLQYHIPYLPPESMWPTQISPETYEKWFKNCTNPCITNEIKIKFLHRVQI